MLALATNEQELLTLDLAATNARPRRHGSPCEGASLAVATELRGKPVRDAVAALASGMFPEKLEEVFLQTFPARPELERNVDSLPVRATWNLVLICLTARSSGQCLPRCGIHEAEIWFRGDSQTTAVWLSAQFSAESLWQAEQLLNGIQIDSEFRALLPYILEEHGPGSRASVMKDPATASSRAAKRESGVFYTPADVADYMVEHARKLYSGDFLTAKSLDPACGTGVFFLAMLRSAIRQHDAADGFSWLDYITSCLHGLDVSGQALDAAAFVLLQECLSELSARSLSPLAAWKLIRRNLVEADALRVDSKRTSTEFFENPLPHLTQLFPNVSDGFGILVGNPPYAAIGERKDFDSLTPRFASLRGGKVSQRANLYSLFVEMMWRFTKPGCNAAALVTPLSIAFHGGAQYENCRHAMSWNGGRWQFAFFDREPHALFGEEVKTRNAILFRFESVETPKRGEAANIETGPLRKWTSRTRANLFQTIDFTAVDSVEITTGIPKLGGVSQAEAFMALKRRLDRLPSLTLRIGTCEVAEALNGEESPKVFVGGTAYNFLNVYRPACLLPDERGVPLSESPVHNLEFKTEAEARAAFAILSSRLTFWLWHVLGDGFHVAGWLYKSIPFGRDSFAKDEFDSLSRLGDVLWRKLQDHRFTSVNGGRQTVGFRPLACNEERDAIDTILAKAAGLKEEFVTELRSFVQKNAVVDSTDERRNHMRKHFAETITR
jgi:hypothetical protein